MKRQILFLVSIIFLLPFFANSQTTFVGPTPYLSDSNIPIGFYSLGMPSFLDDLEDNSLDGGIIGSPGGVSNPSSPFTDSVDGDDGNIDGSGLNGISYFSSQTQTPNGITFTFPFLVKEAGLVWTDGGAGAKWMFEAFGQGMTSLGTLGPIPLGDSVYSGTTAEDRFLGVKNPSGIIAINIKQVSGPINVGIELDHIQYGESVSNTVPTLSQWGLLILGLFLLCIGAVKIWNQKRLVIYS